MTGLTVILFLFCVPSYFYASAGYSIFLEGQNCNEEVCACPFPQVDPFDPRILDYIKVYPPLNCSSGLPSVVYFDGNFLKINHTKVKATVESLDFCRYTPLILSNKNDLTLQNFSWSNEFKQSIKVSEDLEFILAECFLKKELVAETYLARVVEKPRIEKRCEKDFENHVKEHVPSETLSLLLVGMDGMSKQNLIRTMPRTRDYILKTFKARQLEKFNKVGDATYQNVVALLSGHSHKSLQKAYSWNEEDEPFDRIDEAFVWHQYKTEGYRISTVLDSTTGSAFHWLKQGWIKPPFDYYHRPVPLMMKSGRPRKHGSQQECVGKTPIATMYHDFILQLTTKFKNKRKPYFSYNFFTSLSHDDQNEAGRADIIYLEFFQKLKRRNVLNNTVMIFFSDHGPRFGPMRKNTYNGEVESVSPFIFFVFPPWFEKKYTKEMFYFRMNQNRLSSFFDVHATLLDLLYFKGKTRRPRKTPGTSLFQELSIGRTCSEANIPTEFCTCTQMSSARVPHALSERLARYLFSRITDRVKDHKDVCADLSLNKTLSVHALLSEHTSEHDSLYHVSIETSPGGGVFEAMLNYKVSSREASLIGDVIRLNLYRGQDWCVHSLSLKLYCYCKPSTKNKT